MLDFANYSAIFKTLNEEINPVKGGNINYD